MAKGIDSIFNPHSQALRLLEQRLNLIGAISPMRAPRLQSAGSRLQCGDEAGAKQRTLGPGCGGGRPFPVQRKGRALAIPKSPQPSLDGNTVDTQVEKSPSPKPLCATRAPYRYLVAALAFGPF